MNALALHREHARQHTIRRARERHGIQLSLSALTTLEERLRAGEGVLLRPDPDGCRVMLIRFLFDQITVVFDPELDCIKTVLPRFCREFRRRPSEGETDGRL